MVRGEDYIGVFKFSGRPQFVEDSPHLLIDVLDTCILTTEFVADGRDIPPCHHSLHFDLVSQVRVTMMKRMLRKIIQWKTGGLG